MSSRVMDKQGKAAGDKLIAMWLRQLAVSPPACRSRPI
jgi:exodeoxyribonuclease V gamma subunit